LPASGLLDLTGDPDEDVLPAVTLAAGTYMAEVIATSTDGSQGFIIPVTLTISPATAAFFDNIAGALNYSMETSGEAPPSQELQIRNAGAGTLAWTASATTADVEAARQGMDNMILGAQCGRGERRDRHSARGCQERAATQQRDSRRVLHKRSS